MYICHMIINYIKKVIQTYVILYVITLMRKKTQVKYQLSTPRHQIQTNDRSSHSHSKSKNGFFNMARKLHASPKPTLSIEKLAFRSKKYNFPLPPSKRDNSSDQIIKNLQNNFVATDRHTLLKSSVQFCHSNNLRLKLEQKAKEKYQQAFRMNQSLNNNKKAEISLQILNQILKKNHQNNQNIRDRYQEDKNIHSYQQLYTDKNNNQIKTLINNLTNNIKPKESEQKKQDKLPNFNIAKRNFKIHSEVKLQIDHPQQKLQNNKKTILNIQTEKKNEELKLNSIIKPNQKQKSSNIDKLKNQSQQYQKKNIEIFHNIPQVQFKKFKQNPQPKIEKNQQKSINKQIDKIVQNSKQLKIKELTHYNPKSTPNRNQRKPEIDDDEIQEIKLVSNKKQIVTQEIAQNQKAYEILDKNEEFQNQQESQDSIIGDIFQWLQLMDALGQYAKKSKTIYQNSKTTIHKICGYYLSQQLYYYRCFAIDVLSGKKKTNFFDIKWEDVKEVIEEQQVKESVRQLNSQQQKMKNLISKTYQVAKNLLGSQSLKIKKQTNYHSKCCQIISAQFRQIYGIYCKNKLNAKAGRRCCYLIQTYCLLLNLNGEKVKQFEEDDEIKNIDGHISKYKEILLRKDEQ